MERYRDRIETIGVVAVGVWKKKRVCVSSSFGFRSYCMDGWIDRYIFIYVCLIFCLLASSSARHSRTPIHPSTHPPPSSGDTQHVQGEKVSTSAIAANLDRPCTISAGRLRRIRHNPNPGRYARRRWQLFDQREQQHRPGICEL